MKWITTKIKRKGRLCLLNPKIIRKNIDGELIKDDKAMSRYNKYNVDPKSIRWHLIDQVKYLMNEKLKNKT